MKYTVSTEHLQIDNDDSSVSSATKVMDFNSSKESSSTASAKVSSDFICLLYEYTDMIGFIFSK